MGVDVVEQRKETSAASVRRRVRCAADGPVLEGWVTDGRHLQTWSLRCRAKGIRNSQITAIAAKSKGGDGIRPSSETSSLRCYLCQKLWTVLIIYACLHLRTAQ